MSPIDVARALQHDRLQRLLDELGEAVVTVHESTMRPRPRHQGRCTEACGEMGVAWVEWPREGTGEGRAVA